MDFSKCSNEQLTEMLMGSEAARKGEPWNEHQTPMWQAGFLNRMTETISSHATTEAKTSTTDRQMTTNHTIRSSNTRPGFIAAWRTEA